jgi:hypothetical protein
MQEPAALYEIGDYGTALLGTFKDAAKDNPKLELSFSNAI